MKSWQIPLVLLILIVPGAVGFVLGGPGFGFMVIGLTMVALVVFAIRRFPNDPIGETNEPGDEQRILIVTTFTIEDAPTIQRVSDQTGLGDREVEVRLMTPASNTFLDRWATDLEAARERARVRLKVSLSTLDRAGIGSGAQMGDEDIVQAVEDQLVTYDATEVILVTRESDEFLGSTEDLRERLKPTFRHVVLADA